jgi:hypothetical protein
MATPYATLAEFKAQSQLPSSLKDTTIELMLDAAAAVVDGVCNRPDGFVAAASASAKPFVGTDNAYVHIRECVEVTQVEVLIADAWTVLSDTAWNAYAGDWLSPDFDITPYAGILLTGRSQVTFPKAKYPTVRVTARWGYAESVPAQVKVATIAQAHRWFKRGESSWADVLGSPETGQLFYRSKLDADLRLMLEGARLVRPTV